MSEKKYEIANRDDVEFFILLERVRQDWLEQVRDMTDFELMEDRNDYIKNHGIDEDETEEMKQIIDIHTIGIMLEQIRRFSGVVYDV